MDQTRHVVLGAGGNTPSPTDASTTGWHASLELEFALRNSKTALLRRKHQGPLLVQRAFHPENPSVAHVYLLHPPGGIVGGDALHLDVTVQERAHALLTTPGATKLYRSPGRPSRQQQRFEVESGGALEWFPQETILFSGTESQSDLTVELESEGPNGPARFMGWEIVSAGRPGSGERFEKGEFVSKIRLHSAGEPLLLERLVVAGGSPFLDAPWGLRGAPVVGSFMATALGPLAAELSRLVELCRVLTREAFVDLPGEWRGMSALSAPRPYGREATGPGVFVARYLGPSAERARAWMIALWRILRPVLLGHEACLPRIWAT